jgi:hypothetical protein
MCQSQSTATCNSTHTHTATVFVIIHSIQAGNLNSAMFNLCDPCAAPLIGDAKVVFVNDARHQMQPSFLQVLLLYTHDIH